MKKAKKPPATPPPKNKSKQKNSNGPLVGRAAVDTANKHKFTHRNSVFTQILEILRLIDIQSVVDQFQTDKWVKVLDTLQHLKVMIFAQLAGCASLREIENGLEVFRGECNHFGLNFVPGRTTLAYANEHRDWRVFEAIFNLLVHVVQDACMHPKNGLPKKPFKFDGQIFAIDSTTIDLCLAAFDWAQYRAAKGGIKVHTMLDCLSYLPVWAHITDAKSHDQKVLETVDPVRGVGPGAVILVDRAYNAYDMLKLWNDRGITFVCRAKTTMSYSVVEELPIPNKVGRPSNGPKETEESHVISDQIIELASEKGKLSYPYRLRMVTFWAEKEPGSNRPSRAYKFFTNNFKYSPVTIADLYKKRWDIELFFKHLKSNLRIKSFLGTSPNAVKTQVYVALITFLLLKYLQASTQTPWGFSHLAALLRCILHLNRHLKRWLDRKRFDDEDFDEFGQPRNRGQPTQESLRPGYLF
jgi:hypothetical protein